MNTVSNGGRIRAVLGPTNTGKTRFAIQRMLSHRTGVIGLPLRLLAREVYDQVRQELGPSAVALITGEERIIPKRARYWVCTVEAMPVASGADFLCVDEIQLCGDRERGHVFTDRLLRARGQAETVFLGSETMRPAISKLIGGVQFERRERLSNLSFTGSRRISRMRPRSALVAFSVEEVYAVAEIVRRQRGGAAVVMGALSPRTRNAQVELYQNGDVDFLVATDAIGMGLNLNIDHVAFVGFTKFDGNRIRRLAPNEIAQIAGRAGRFRTPGTFGTTADSEPLDSQTVAAIEENRFRNLHALQWRNSDLDFRSADTLLASLRSVCGNPMLARSAEAEDMAALRELSGVAEIRERLRSSVDVKLLWGVCQIPNFLNLAASEHAELIRTVFMFILDKGSIPDEWLEGQVRRIDRVDGEVDTLARRIAGIRIWTYVSQRPDWVENSGHWRERTRAVEDRISDALHAGLTKRFVDRRTSVLLKQMKQKETLVATVNSQGEVEVEGQHVGRIEGFRFIQAASSTPEEERAVRTASLKILAPEFALRAGRLAGAQNNEIDLTEQGGLMWGEHSVGKLVPGKSGLEPGIEVFVDEAAGEEARKKVERRLRAFVEHKISDSCEAIKNLAADAEITGLSKGVAYRIVESFGVIERSAIAGDVKELDQENRKLLRRHGVRFGQHSVYVHPILRPEATRWRIVLWSLAGRLEEFPPAPPPGLVTIPADPAMPKGYYPISGYTKVGDLAIRIDMLERLLNLLREADSRRGFEATPDMLSITGLTLDGFAGLMRGLGYAAARFERPKVKEPHAEVASVHEETNGTGGGGEPGEAGSAEGEEGISGGNDAGGKIEEADDPKAKQVAADFPLGSDSGAGLPESVATGTGESRDESIAVAVAETGMLDAEDAEEEIAVGYTFSWRAKGHGRGRRAGNSGAEGDRSGGADRRRRDAQKPRKSKSRKQEGQKGEKRSTRQEKKEKPIDPDNPFNVLMRLKEKL